MTIINRPLVLPSYRLDTPTEDNESGYVNFPTSEYSWEGRLVSEKYYETLPIAWTPYQEAAAFLLTEEEFKTLYVYDNSFDWFAKANNLIRSLKIIICEFDGYPLLPPSPTLAEIFDPIKDQLKKNKILVLGRAARLVGSGFIYVFPVFLPWYDVESHTQIVNLIDGSGGLFSVTRDMPKINHMHWRGGEVLYLICNGQLSATAGPYAVWASGGYGELTDTIAAHTQLVRDCYPRYDRVNYHCMFMWSPTWGQGGNDPANKYLATFNNVINSMVDFGVTSYIINLGESGGREKLIIESRRKAIEFFGLKG